MNIEALYQQAELAQAAYAINLIPGDLTKDIAKLIKSTDPGACGMTPAQATAFANEWKVVNQLPDTASGFSGTLFFKSAEGKSTTSPPTGTNCKAARTATGHFTKATTPSWPPSGAGKTANWG